MISQLHSADTVLKGKKVLIVDDDIRNIFAMTSILEPHPMQILSAETGKGVIESLQTTPDVDVVLMDIMMPDMDGFETARLIRQRKSSEHIPIIFITAFGDEMHVAQGYSLGAVDYILAPVVPDVLRSKVSVFVDLFRKTEQVRRQAESLRRRGRRWRFRAKCRSTACCRR